MGGLDREIDSLHSPGGSSGLCGPDERFAHDIEQCTKMGIVIDFDGTLSYLARSASKAALFVFSMGNP